jgi:hypothetical protein
MPWTLLDDGSSIAISALERSHYSIEFMAALAERILLIC